MQTDVEVLNCPGCGTEVQCTIRHNGFQAAATSIGPSILACPACRTFVQTGRREWNQMGTIRRAWYVLSRFLWLMAGSFFLGGGFACIACFIALECDWIQPEQETRYMILFYFIGTIALGALLLRNAVAEIRASQHRSMSPEHREQLVAAYPFPGFPPDEDVESQDVA